MNGGRNGPAFVLFDWGDTVMKDDPRRTTPMWQWPSVEAVEGAEEVLRALHVQRTVILATGAVQSDEADIWRALKRVNLDTHVDRIFCFKNTGFRKPAEEFYRRILDELHAAPAETVMVGDDFDGDVLGANRAGIPGIWLNENGVDNRSGALYRTIHRLDELLSLFD